MNLNLKIFAGNTQIGYMPSSAMLQTDDVTSLSDVINSWVLFTQRSIDNDTLLGLMVRAFANQNLLGSLARHANSVQVDVPTQDDLEVLTDAKGVQYVVLERESLDFGLVEATLQLRTEYLTQIAHTDELDAVVINLNLVYEFLMSRLIAGLNNPIDEKVADKIVEVNTPNPAPVTSEARPKVTPPKYAAYGDVQIASGFFGVNDGHVATQSPAEAARSQLARFLAKQ